MNYPTGNSAMQAIGNGLSTVGSGASDLASIYGGTQRGGAQGALQSLYGAGKLYNLVGGPGSAAVSPYLSDIGSGLGVLQGLQTGGFSGDAQAALSAARLGLQGATQSGLMSTAAAAPYAQALGYAAIPLDLYNFAKNWQSGATGSDALSGAETGAAIGSVIPGIGTLIGGLAGGAIGALSSAFGGGRPDPETEVLNNVLGQYGQAYNQNPQAAQAAVSQLSPAQSFQLLAGAMDAKNNTPGHAQPIEQAFGRMGEQNLLTSMANEVNSAYNNGQITPGESAQQVYNSVVSPWLASQTGGQGLIGGAAGEGGLLGGSIENLLGDWMSGSLTNNTAIGIAGQTDPYLQPYQGASGLPSAALIRGTPYGGAAVGQFSQVNPGNGASVASFDAAKAAQPHAAGGRMRRKRLKHFDDGGLSDGLDFGNTSDLSNIDLSLDSSDPYSLDFSAANPYAGSTFDQYVATDPSWSPEGNSSSSSSSSGSWLSGLNSDLGSAFKGLSGIAALGTLAQGLFGKSNSTSMPTAPSQYQGVISIPTPSYSMQANPYYQSMSPSQWLHYGETPNEPLFYGNGNALPVTAMSAPNLQQAVQSQANSSSPYGSPYGPGATPQAAQLSPYQQALSAYGTPQSNLQSALAMYGGNPYAAVAAAPMLPQSQPYMGAPMQPMVMAHGGSAYDPNAYEESIVYHSPHYVQGPGDGTSDDINAKLSNGEYVIDAPTVSLLGNGSNEAGARKLDQFRHEVRRHAGKKLVRGKQPMHAKEPMQYLRGVA